MFSVIQGKLVVEELLSRRKAKKELEYEVKWWGLPSNPKHNKWFVRSKCATPSPSGLAVSLCCEEEVWRARISVSACLPGHSSSCSAQKSL